MLAVLEVVLFALDLYWWIIIGSAVFSWLYAFNVVNGRNQFVAAVGNFLYQATEPVLKPIRRFMPNLGTIDISPIVLLLLLMLVQRFLILYVAPAIVHAGV
ncbi:MAG: YggT family protein [Phyllobacteriaceae bacterium]|nr:YggT family protein [Phyllobacteriaceae bacterium]